jgi:hypothetical protein
MDPMTLWTRLPQATRLAAVIATLAIATATIWAVVTDTDLFPTPPGQVVTTTTQPDPSTLSSTPPPATISAGQPGYPTLQLDKLGI